MAHVRIAFFGDVVGQAGRSAFAYAASHARAVMRADLVFVNGENAKHGRGLHPDGYAELRRGGADLVTLGDHAQDDPRINALLKAPGEPVFRPVNFPEIDPATKWCVRVRPPGGAPRGGSGGVFVITVLGRVFMARPGGEPFAAIDRAMEEILKVDADARVIVEIHCEATSEKGGAGWHCAAKWGGHVVAVVGTHTHVQTNDAQLLDGRVAFLTDLGFTGAHSGIIGFTAESSIPRIRDQRGALKLAEGEVRADGALMELDLERGRAVSIEAVSVVVPGG